MFDASPETTVLLLGILAVVSVFQTVLLVAVCLVGYRFFREAARAVRDLERLELAATAAQVNGVLHKLDAILGDLKDVTTRVTRRTERADVAIDHTVQRVDETAGRIWTRIQSRRRRLGALLHGARCAIRSFSHSRRASGEAPLA